MPVVVTMPYLDAARLRAFGAFAPSLDVLTFDQMRSTVAAGMQSAWLIEGYWGPAWRPRNWFASLDGAMRRVNFTATGLVSGATEAFRQDGVTWALPVGASVCAVQYRPEAFAAADVPEPTGAWTLDDFALACAKIGSAIAAGKLPGYRGPLPALGFSDQVELAVWEGFVRGFGGALATAGQYTFTDAGALAGFGQVVRLFALHGTAPPAPADGEPLGTGAAVTFTLFDGHVAPGPGWKLARFPRLPQQAAIPVRILGAALGYVKNDNGIPDFTAPLAAEAPEEATDAVLQFFRWLQQGQLQAPVQSPYLPVVADSSAQTAFWSALDKQVPGAAALGDWRSFVPTEAGWPPLMNGNDVYATLLAALRGARDDPSSLQGRLRDAEDMLNGKAAAYAASLHAAEGAAARQASAVAAFPVDGPPVASGGASG